jgi:hypothetical protein
MRDYEVEVWVPDFDDVKLDTFVMFEIVTAHPLYGWNFRESSMFDDVRPGDLLRVVEVYGCRPRDVKLELLRTSQTVRVRVDRLLEWHDNQLITILPC